MQDRCAVFAVYAAGRCPKSFVRQARSGLVAVQVFILDALSAYTPKDGKEAEETIERVTPRLQHANCAVVLSAVKVGCDSSAGPSKTAATRTAT